MSAGGRLVLSAVLGVVVAGCSGSVSPELLEEVSTNVVTLQSGTMSDLRHLRGRGPFRRYEHPPDEMLEVIEAAARKARGLGGEPVSAVFVSERYGEVRAKERLPRDAHRESYAGPFRSAVVATVHPIEGEPNASRVEIHATNRGPFHRGRVDWERDLPRWIDQVLRERAAPPETPRREKVRPIP